MLTLSAKGSVVTKGFFRGWGGGGSPQYMLWRYIGGLQQIPRDPKKMVW